MKRPIAVSPQEKLNETYWGLHRELKNLSNKDACIDYVLRNFTTIQHIPQTNSSYGVGIGDICLESPDGVGGGTSSKAFNFVFNIGKLRRLLVNKSVDLLLASNLGLLITAVKLCAQIYRLKNVQIEERHAIVMVALWRECNILTNQVYDVNLVQRINRQFRKANRHGINMNELTSILSDLDDLHCIQLNPNGTITLKEKIKETYNRRGIYLIS